MQLTHSCVGTSVGTRWLHRVLEPGISLNQVQVATILAPPIVEVSRNMEILHELVFLRKQRDKLSCSTSPHISNVACATQRNASHLPRLLQFDVLLGKLVACLAYTVPADVRAGP